jgi:fatty-acyl-CoA synthase
MQDGAMEFNLAQIQEAIAEAIPERECLVYRDSRLTWREITERTRRLANYLLSRGLSHHRERDSLRGWESGQDHLALYLFNCNEYIEGMLGAYKARVAPFNVNYRYVEEELVYLLKDAKSRGIIYHASLAPVLGKILPELPDLEVLIQVGDDSGNDLLQGAVDYEAALASAPPERPQPDWSPDDLYIVYTGGTTGMPKGVLWRQADIYIAAMGGRKPDGSEPETLDQIVERAHSGWRRSMPTAPMMHGAAQWVAFNAMHSGNVTVLQSVSDHMDPDDVLSTAAREKANIMLIVGDAFARPLLDQLHKKEYDLSNLSVLLSGGAALNAGLKKQLLELLPKLIIIDNLGSSETGAQASNVSTAGSGASTGTFALGHGACVLSDDLTRQLHPGESQIGWFAQSGRVPLGYLGDRDKTERTFPLIAGTRYSVPGDRARVREDGILELLGRDSVTITSGGEKIFAEEVEHALKHHLSVYDAVVCGRPSERWGSEVVAIVQLREGSAASREDLHEECARHIARYKLPKAFVFTDHIARSPSGKADYRWAKRLAEGTAGE